MRHLFVAAVLAGAPLAWAQESAPPSPAAPEAPATTEPAPIETAPAPPPEPTPAPAEPAPTPAAPAGVQLEPRVEGLEEQLARAQASLLALERLKLSGYVQARFQAADDSVARLDPVTGDTLVRDGFSVRRGRLKAAYAVPWVQVVLQIDATPNGVLLRDAEVWLAPRKTLALVVGQTKWPFGFEVQQSSVDREFPERSQMSRAFARDERDRGGKVVARFNIVRAALGVFDGNGINNRPAGVVLSRDNDTEKDVIGRVGVDARWLAGGLSFWEGRTLRPSTGTYVPRTRLGADVQLNLDVLPLGSTALQAEWMVGRTYFDGRGREVFDQTAMGWYALLLQDLTDQSLIGVRYDYFDPATGTGRRADPNDPTRVASTNATSALGVLASYRYAANLKISGVYEVRMTQVVPGTVDPRDNVFTLQFQGRF